MMRFRFQSFVDVSTSASSMQVLQWAVGGKEVFNRCRHLFGAYKYFKLGKIHIKMVPASTLPVDPQGLSYDADDPLTVDPRDQMNPGLVRITNGEDIFTNVSALSDDQQMQVYNTMMLDPRWSKFMLQSGFRRSAYPLYWQIGQLSQDKYPGTVENMPLVSSSGSGVSVSSIVAMHEYKGSVSDNVPLFRTQSASSPRGIFQVGHRGKIGYLPTDYYQEVPTGNDVRFFGDYGANNIPEVKVITCVLPKAYKTIYYYRVFITEEVYFTGLRSSPPVVTGAGEGQYLGLDQFMFGSTVEPNAIGAGIPLLSGTYIDNNGGDLP